MQWSQQCFIDTTRQSTEQKQRGNGCGGTGCRSLALHFPNEQRRFFRLSSCSKCSESQWLQRRYWSLCAQCLGFGFAMTVRTDSAAHPLFMFLWSSHLHAFHIIDCLCRVWLVSAAEMWAARLRRAVKFRPLTVHSRQHFEMETDAPRTLSDSPGVRLLITTLSPLPVFVWHLALCLKYQLPVWPRATTYLTGKCQSPYFPRCDACVIKA